VFLQLSLYLNNLKADALTVSIDLSYQKRVSLKIISFILFKKIYKAIFVTSKI